MIVCSYPLYTNTPSNPSRLADLCEYRLDFCSDLTKIDFAMFTKKHILTFRGEGFTNDVLDMMIGSNALIDIDISEIERVKGKIDFARVIISKHMDYYNPQEIKQFLESNLCPYAFKFVTRVQVFSDLVEIKELIRQSNKKNVIFLDSGHWHYFQRCLYNLFGSMATYIADSILTAEGQITADEYSMVVKDGIRGGEIVGGILGGEQVNQSLSVYYYNQYFIGNEYPYIYLPIPAMDANQAIEAIQWLKMFFVLLGFSVTSPLKKSISSILGLHIPIVNTLVFSDDRASGYFYNRLLDRFILCTNTDTLSLSEFLKSKKIPQDASIMIYGTGATAEAFCKSIKQAGYTLYIDGRNKDRLAELREKFALESMVPKEVYLLINTTPLGVDPNDDISFLPAFQSVMDLPYNLAQDTALIKYANEHNLESLSGWEFFELQFEIQLDLILQSE